MRAICGSHFVEPARIQLPIKVIARAKAATSRHAASGLTFRRCRAGQLRGEASGLEVAPMQRICTEKRRSVKCSAGSIASVSSSVEAQLMKSVRNSQCLVCPGFCRCNSHVTTLFSGSFSYLRSTEPYRMHNIFFYLVSPFARYWRPCVPAPLWW